MRMTSEKLRKILMERLENDERNLSYHREKDQLRIENKHNLKGITISLAPILAKWEVKKEKAIEEIIYYVDEALKVMGTEQKITGNEKKVFPVIRSASFPSQTNEGKKLIFDEHTAETRIYYSLDLGNSYRLIDEEMLEKENITAQAMKEMAKFNLRSLPCPVKKDTVHDNDYFFVNTNDGYDASRILNEQFLEEMEEKIVGTMALSIPHHDVLIIADIRNDIGYDVLAQMTMSFFSSGNIPITSLSFLYENQQLEPIFILAKNKPLRKE